MFPWLIIISVIYAVFWAILCAIVAHSKKRDVSVAFLAGFLLGIFAFVYYAFVEKGHREPSDSEINDLTKKKGPCPKCKSKKLTATWIGEDLGFECDNCHYKWIPKILDKPNKKS